MRAVAQKRIKYIVKLLPTLHVSSVVVKANPVIRAVFG